MPFFRNIRITLEMIKWEHSIFALPFALSAAMLAADGWPTRWQVFWIVVCMVSARSAAMAFNRIVDIESDTINPRTKSRALPAGLLPRSFVALFVLLSCAIFVIGAAELNRLTLYLSPVALAVVLLYSYSKRFTRWSHILLGFALGIAPAAAWIAVRGSLDARILLLTVAVTCWVAGFDVLYACQDCDFDRQSGLHSVPQAFGIGRALMISRMLHLVALAAMCALVYSFGLGIFAIAGVCVVALLLVYEQSLVRVNDLSRLNAAFFTMNGVIAVVFFLFVTADILMRR